MNRLKTGPIIFYLVFWLSNSFSQTMTPPGQQAAAPLLSHEEMVVLFNQAKTYFLKANEAAGQDPGLAEALYQKSVLYYEKIIQQGKIKNGKLFYNLGNAYFKLGDVGQAILNYKRARLFIGRDKNLKQNLAYVRSQQIDQFKEREEQKIGAILFFWHFALPSGIKMILFGLCFALFWAQKAVYLFFKKPFFKWGIGLCAALALILLGSIVIESIIEQRQEPGVIIQAQVIARKGDSLTYQPSFLEPLHSGTEFLLLEKRRDWYKIRLMDQRQCWIPARSAGLVKDF